MHEGFATALPDVAKVLTEGERLGFVGHVGPDGDALGSAVALALAAKTQGKQAYVSFGAPFAVAHEFRFLDLSPVVAPEKFPEGLDAVVVCDTGTIRRLGSIADAVVSASTVVVLDHHLSAPDIGDVRAIDPTAGATAQLAYYLLDHLDWPLSSDIAAALYVGLVTDTGRFQYSNTTPEVHRVAARLLQAGALPHVVGQHVYEEAPFGYLKVAGAVLTRAELARDERLVWSILHRSDLESARVGYEDTDGLIDLLRVAEEAQVACLLKDLGGGRVKGSLRSRGVVDVEAIAGRFGGGGHHNAAGFTIDGTPQEVIERVLEALR